MIDMEYYYRELQLASDGVIIAARKVTKAEADLEAAHEMLEEAKRVEREWKARVAGEEQGQNVIPGIVMAGVAEAKGA